jgi:hypothetical protein
MFGRRKFQYDVSISPGAAMVFMVFPTEIVCAAPTVTTATATNHGAEQKHPHTISQLEDSYIHIVHMVFHIEEQQSRAGTSNSP